MGCPFFRVYLKCIFRGNLDAFCPLHSIFHQTGARMTLLKWTHAKSYLCSTPSNRFSSHNKILSPYQQDPSCPGSPATSHLPAFHSPPSFTRLKPPRTPEWSSVMLSTPSPLSRSVVTCELLRFSGWFSLIIPQRIVAPSSHYLSPFVCFIFSRSFLLHIYLLACHESPPETSVPRGQLSALVFVYPQCPEQCLEHSAQQMLTRDYRNVLAQEVCPEELFT